MIDLRITLQHEGSGRTRSAKVSDNSDSKLGSIACNCVKLKEGFFSYGWLYVILKSI